MRCGNLLLFLILFLSASVEAQNLKFGDFGFFSIHEPFPKPEPKTISPVFLFDGQNIFVGGKAVRLGGIKAGILHNPTGIKAGLGFYAFTNRLISEHVFINELGHATIVESDFGLMNLFIEPTLFKNERFFVSVPVTLGYGAIDQYYTTILGSLRPHRELSLTSFSIQVNGEVKLFYWIGLGAGLGYHFFGTGDRQIQKEYSGLMYNIKLKIDIIDIYKTVAHQLNKRNP